MNNSNVAQQQSGCLGNLLGSPFLYVSDDVLENAIKWQHLKKGKWQVFYQEWHQPVSYTHLTLPTIYSV